MILNPVEKKTAQELAQKHDVVKKMLEELESYEDNPAKVFYKEMSLTIKAISEELRAAREDKEPKLKILSDTHLFGMIKDLFTNSEKIFAGLKKGKLDIDPNARQEEDDKGEVII